METTTFYSYKGGSGRSLLLANAARYLALAGKRVVALDLDFEAPGLHYKLHIGRPGERTGDVVPQRGVVDYLLATQSGDGSASPTGFVTSVPLPPGAPGRLHLMPAGSAPSAEYWRALTRLSRHELLGDPEGEAPVAAFLELKTLIEEELDADALLIDARTGITELGGIATTILADKVVCLLLDNSESLTGARAVIRSLGRAQRLRDQAPIEVIPVLSRVPEPDASAEERVLAFLNEQSPSDESTVAFEHIFFLRDDRDLAARERLYFGEDPTPVRNDSGAFHLPAPDVTAGLGRDYVELIGALFPSEGADASEGASRSAALRRQQAVRQMRAWLTRDDSGRRHRPVLPRAFGSEQIDEGVKLDYHHLPYADLVAYSYDREPVLAALYREDLEPLKQWPREGPRCVFLFNVDDKEALGKRAFTRARKGRFTERTDPPGANRSVEWALRFPAAYSALSDPGDQSVSALLASVQAGHDDFIGLLVREWQHASFQTLHSGMPFRPRLARQIIDGLAAVNDVETAQHILWRTAPDPFERTYEGMDEGAGLEELTTRNLHAPLFWRLPVAAKTGFWRHTRDRSSTAGLQMLARDVIGLRFDQDQDLRDDVGRLIETDGLPSEAKPKLKSGDAPDLRNMWSHFRERELAFELSTKTPPELIRRTIIRSIVPDLPRARGWEQAEASAEAALTSESALTALLRGKDGGWSVPTTNLLAGYDPESATVTLYTRLLEWSARVLDIPLPDLENMVFLHETVHAVCHLGRDLDGRHWAEFALPSSRDLAFRPSELHEGLAQYFTFRMIERLGDAGMMAAFERLSAHQPAEYQAWRRMRSVPVEQMRKALIRARAGFDGTLWPLPGDVS